MSDLAATEAAPDGDAYLLIAYGRDLFYHFNALFAALRLSAARRADDPRPIVIYTDRPKIFAHFPFDVVPITPAQMREWSLEGRYHFRIKNRVMHDVFARGFTRVLFTDSDLVFLSNPADDFAFIAPHRAVMHENEGTAKRRAPAYARVPPLPIAGRADFVITGAETMWRSSVMGLHRDMADAIDLADALICAMVGKVGVHSIEQFALGLALMEVAQVRESVGRYMEFSTSGKKAYARGQLFAFFQAHRFDDFESLRARAAQTSLRRPMLDAIAHKVFGRRPPAPDFTQLIGA